MKKLFASLVLVFLLCMCAFAVPSAVTDWDAADVVYDNDTVICESIQAPEFVSYTPELSEADLSAQTIYEYFAEKLKNKEREIDVERFNVYREDVMFLAEDYTITLWMYPELYNVVNRFDYYVSKNSGLVTKIVPHYYDIDKTEVNLVREEINAELDKIVSFTNSSMTDVEKLLVVYDQIIMNSYYDETLANTTAKTLLLDGNSVCQGYASVFYAVATKLGIPCGFVESDAMNHVWNVVNLDGKWYHVDMTWDDTTYVNSLRVTHKYFLKSNNWFLSSDGGHSGFTKVSNDSDLYDEAYWNNAVSKLVLSGDDIYYVNNDSYISKYDTVNETVSNIYEFTNRWQAVDSGTYWIGTFSTLDVYKDRLYFNTNNQIKSCKFDGSDVVTEFELPSTSNQSIYGCYVQKAKLYYALGEKDNTSKITAVNSFSLLKPGEELTGDITLDNELDINDAIYLFQHSMMPEIYQLEYSGNVDFTKDGTVDINDAILLFQHSMMPEIYPLD